MSKNEYSSIIWNINNFLYCWQKNDEAITSPTFCIYMPEETKWKLMVFPCGVAWENVFTAFFLYRDKDCNGDDSIKVEYSLDILSSDGSCLAQIPHTGIFQRDMRNGFDNYVHKITKASTYINQDTLTVRCKFFRLNDKKTEMRQIYARTIIGVEKRFLRWSIENLTTMTQNQTQSIVMKSDSKEVIMQIKVALTSDNEEKICVGISSFDHRMKYSAVKTFVLDSQKQEVDSGEFKCWFDSENCQMFPLIITKKHLMDNKSIYLPNDILTLSFQLTVCTGLAFEGIEKSICECSPYPFPYTVSENWRKCIAHEKIGDCPCALITDLNSLFKDQYFCDMKLRTKTNDYPVHTSILGARSPVFRAMFSCDMKEKVNGCVDVSDLEDETVRQFLLYLYSDQLGDLKWDDALQLYKIADKYVVISLRDKCSTFLKINLNLKNACEALMLSDLHQDKDLKDISQNFILKNGKEMFKSEEWKLLADADSKLAMETMLRNWNEE